MVLIQYRYDELNRLVAAVYDNGQEISYAYDAAGNQISVTIKGEAAAVPKKLGQIKPPAKTPRKPPPPEKL
jgi:YD repeat-containing protein